MAGFAGVDSLAVHFFVAGFFVAALVAARFFEAAYAAVPFFAVHFSVHVSAVDFAEEACVAVPFFEVGFFAHASAAHFLPAGSAGAPLFVADFSVHVWVHFVVAGFFVEASAAVQSVRADFLLFRCSGVDFFVVHSVLVDFLFFHCLPVDFPSPPFFSFFPSEQPGMVSPHCHGSSHSVYKPPLHYGSPAFFPVLMIPGMLRVLHS